MSTAPHQEATARAATLRLGHKLGVFAGYYFFVLGCLAVVSFVVGLFLGKGLQLNLTFLVFLLLGRGLWEMRNGARVTVLVISGFYIAVALTSIELALMRGPDWDAAPFFPSNDGGRTLAAYLASAGAFVVIYGIPFSLLLHPAARRIFRARTKLRKVRLPDPKRRLGARLTR